MFTLVSRLNFLLMRDYLQIDRKVVFSFLIFTSSLSSKLPLLSLDTENQEKKPLNTALSSAPTIPFPVRELPECPGNKFLENRFWC